MTKTAKILITILVMIVITLVAVLDFNKTQIKNLAADYFITEQSDWETSSSENLEKKAKNTYKNTDFNYSIEYPVNYSYRTNNDSIGGLYFYNHETKLAPESDDSPASVNIVTQQKTNEDIETFLKNIFGTFSGGITILEQNPQSLNHIDTTNKIKFRVAGEMFEPIGYAFDKDNYRFVIFTLKSYSKESVETLESTLSTFKFTNSRLDEKSDWKTYSNEKYGYSIQYPKDWTVANEKFVVDGVNNIPSIIYISNENNEYQIFIEINKKEDLKNLEALESRDILIDGKNQTVYIFPNGYECMGEELDCSYLNIPIKHGDYWYKIGARKKVKFYQNEYIKILSTFKFIK